jgi:hypothetical protein
MDETLETASGFTTATVARVEAPESDDAPLPDHLIKLPGEQWGLWRCAALRGAGFPAAQVLALSNADCTAVADELLEAETAVERARASALAAVNKELDALRLEAHWDDKPKRVPLVKALRFLKVGKQPPAEDLPIATRAQLERMDEASARVAALADDFNQAFKNSVVKTSEAIQQTLNDARFREAVIWQNRRAFHAGMEALLRQQPGVVSRTFKQRQNEELVANYLQRYCVKNDTIGFFGPVGWARLTSQDEALNIKLGPGLLATRNVFFEGWGIDVLAEELASQAGMRPWAAPRRMPYLYLENNKLHLPLSRPLMLPPKYAAVLAACDGKQSARGIVLSLKKNVSLGVRSEAEVYKILDELKQKGLISWTFEIPLELHPERTLRSRLEQIADESLRTKALSTLAELDEARLGVALAAGDIEQLDQAIGRLEEIFARLTNAASTRAAGKTYAARTLIYEDCRRDAQVDVGTEIFEALGNPLSLLLTSARWLTFTTAELCLQTLGEIYDELSAKSGSPVVDGVSFWMRAQPLVFAEENSLLASVERLFQERWAAILNLSPDARQTTFNCEDLRPRVLATFAAPSPGWQPARYHCPDLMIAADNLEAVRRGDYQLVIGEVHVGLNTLGSSLFLAQHPQPEELFRALESDFPAPRLMPFSPKSWPNVTSRTHNALISSKDVRLVVAQDSIPEPENEVVNFGELVVEKSVERLVARTRDGRLRFDIIEAFGDALSGLVVNSFKLLPPGPHTPRITFDHLVVCRESWSFTASGLRFAWEKDEASGFLTARRWARSHGLPRFVFVKVPVERKPFYVDFDSPIYLSIFARMIRRTTAQSPEAQIRIAEMLPNTNQIWLMDAEGQHYTSEIRMVALDLL